MSARRYTLWVEWIRMPNDAAEAPGWIGEQQPDQHVGWDRPRLVQVVRTEEQPVDDPVPPAESILHPGQEQAPKEQLFAQDGIEHEHRHDDGEQPPVAMQCCPAGG